MRRAGPVLALLFVLLLAPGRATAQECVAAPGTAAVDQYCEFVPEVDRDRDTANRIPGTPQSRRTVDRIAAAGPAGTVLAQTLEPSRRKRSDAPAAPPAADGPVAAISNSTSVGAGISIWFIVGLVLIALGVAAAYWRQRRA